MSGEYVYCLYLLFFNNFRNKILKLTKKKNLNGYFIQILMLTLNISDTQILVIIKLGSAIYILRLKISPTQHEF